MKDDELNILISWRNHIKKARFIRASCVLALGVNYYNFSWDIWHNQTKMSLLPFVGMTIMWSCIFSLTTSIHRAEDCIAQLEVQDA